jgi:threonyl-tRNA synthetase
MYPDCLVGGVSFYQDRAVVDFDNLKVKENELNKIQREAMSQKGNFSFSKVALDEVDSLNDLQKNIAKDISSKDAIDFDSFKLVSLFIDPVLEAKEISNLKIYNLSSAYWKNNSNNNQLVRFTVKGFSSSADFDDYEKKLREAQDRSHIKLGKELGLFVISDLVGAGLPLLTAKGNIIRREIINFLWQLHKGTNHQWVWTPHIAKDALYKTSGHWDKFGDELFKVTGKGDEKFVMKPMNCPHHMQIFDSMNLSYRDMPVRMFEPATIYRDEKSGQLHGLSRVRAITQDDGHLFCRVSQIKQEVAMIVGVIRKFYEIIGMDDYWVSLSVRGEDKSKYIGSEEVWNIAQSALDEAAIENKLNYKRIEGEAAFYGPKLDFMFKDALGREWQLATIQCDFTLPERFNLSFMNEKGEKERPVVIHRAISGSLERFMSVLIEHFAGKFPLWLSPVQVKILTVNDTHAKFAYEVATKLRSFDIRVEVDDRVESIGKKAREARLARVNYVLTVGDKEVAGNSLAVMKRGTNGPEFGVDIDAFVAQIVKERDDRVI